jgi:hypothetical protein
MLAEMPHPHRGAASLAARGLNEDRVREDVNSLAWMGLLDTDGDSVSITSQGIAVHYEAESEALTARLVDVVTFADELELRSPALDDELHALRQLAQGAWTLEKAITHVNRKSPPGDD